MLQNFIPNDFHRRFICLLVLLFVETVIFVIRMLFVCYRYSKPFCKFIFIRIYYNLLFKLKKVFIARAGVCVGAKFQSTYIIKITKNSAKSGMASSNVGPINHQTNCPIT